jgi:membrane protein YdbS with pleckstrin-like domain
VERVVMEIVLPNWIAMAFGIWIILSIISKLLTIVFQIYTTKLTKFKYKNDMMNCEENKFKQGIN